MKHYLRYIPSAGQLYYYISSGGTIVGTKAGIFQLDSNLRYKVKKKNVFKTRAECSNAILAGY